MSEWKEYRFSEFVNINPSVTLKAGQEYSFVEMKDLENGNKYCTPKIKKRKGGGAKFQNGDTLFARITPCLENGKICQVKGLEDNLGFGSTEFYVFRGNQGISDTEFVYYLSRWDDVREHAETNLDGTSGRQRVPKACFDDLVISMPPLPEQTAIASVLSSFDDKIDLLHRENATLEKIAETLFRQWFVEEAKEEWQSDTLSFFADFFNGKSRPSEVGVIPVYGGNGILGYTNKSNYSGKSIIIGRVGAYCGSLYYENKDIWVSDNALLVKSKKTDSAHFLFYLLKTLELNSMAEGSSHPLLTQTLLKSIEVRIPPIKKINTFDNLVEDVHRKIESNQTQIHTLIVLRDTLLPKLMSGKVAVKL